MVKDVIFVKALEDFRLLLEFEGQEFRVFDFHSHYKDKSGLPKEISEDIELFKTVKLDGTGTVCWSNGYDIAVEFIYNMSTLISELSKGLFESNEC